ncbi:MAG: phosphopantetheine-binding protein [Planctomycetota bacterium]
MSCSAVVEVEPTLLFGDAVCPRCGSLIWFAKDESGARRLDLPRADEIVVRVRELIAARAGVEVIRVTGDVEQLGELGLDSLDYVEVVMAVEDEFGFNWPV